MEKLEQVIKEIVNEEQGIKEIALVVKIVQTYAESGEEKLPELIKIFNNHVVHGCCGGCI